VAWRFVQGSLQSGGGQNTSSIAFDPTRAVNPAALGSADTSISKVKPTGVVGQQTPKTPSLTTPEHKLAHLRASLDHHSHEYHRNNVVAHDASQPHEVRQKAAQDRDNHQHFGAKINQGIQHFESKGVQDKPEHHDDWINHYRANRGSYSGISGKQQHELHPTGLNVIEHHNKYSTRNWDQKYGAPKEIDYESIKKERGLGGVKTPTSEEGTSALKPSALKRSVGEEMDIHKAMQDLMDKAIQGQQPLAAKLGQKDSAYSQAPHASYGGQKDDHHINAATHYIKADFHARQKPSGVDPHTGQTHGDLATSHKQAYSGLLKQGASPSASHFKQAIAELPPHYSQVMKGLLEKGISQYTRPDMVSPQPLKRAKGFQKRPVV
jgi:hypothetical protein